MAYIVVIVVPIFINKNNLSLQTDMSGFTTTSLQNAKAVLRAEMKKRIAALSKYEKQIQSEAVANKVV